ANTGLARLRLVRVFGIFGLGALVNAPIESLTLEATAVAAPGATAGWPLREVTVLPRLSMPLEMVLRRHKTVATGNGKPASEFWQSFDAERAKFDDWCKTVAAKAPDEQVKAVTDELVRRNPGFVPGPKDIGSKFEGGVVTQFWYFSPVVEDLTPVRAFPA